jgi:hypothetical protein
VIRFVSVPPLRNIQNKRQILGEAHRQSCRPKKRSVRIAGPEWVEDRVCVGDLINGYVTE